MIEADKRDVAIANANDPIRVMVTLRKTAELVAKLSAPEGQKQAAATEQPPPAQPDTPPPSIGRAEKSVKTAAPVESAEQEFVHRLGL
jgi:hypothetical protein